MISHKHKCIFIEVPKTGSSSIRDVIGQPRRPHLNIWQTKYEIENNWTYYGGKINRIFSILYLLLPSKTRRKIGERKFSTYFKFGFVRNPWDRVVSLYHRNEALQMKNKMTFESFVEWIKYSSSTCRHSSPHRFQLDWFVDPHGNIMVDFIGRFENLIDDWQYICNKTDIKKSLPHKRMNRNKNKHYTEYYTPKTKEIIEQKFRIDIEYFGYKFNE